MSQISEVLTEMLGPEGVEIGPGAPVAFPASTAEVSRVLASASAQGWRTRVAGAMSWLEGGGGPAEAGEIDLMLSCSRLKGIELYEPADLTLTAEGGTLCSELASTAKSNQQFLPLDPPGVAQGTLGGLLSTASSGPLRAVYGTPREHVLGLTLVTGDGRILELGGRVVKNVAGFDLVRLVVGSFGELGAITRATVRLFPIPASDLSLIWSGGRDEMLAAACRVAIAPLVFPAVEVRRREGTDDGLDLVVRLLDDVEGVGAARRVLVEHLGEPSQVIDNSTDGQTLQHLTQGEVGATLVIRLSHLPDRLAGLWERGERLARLFPSGECALSAHVTEGVVRLAWHSSSAGLPGRDVAKGIRATREDLEASGGSLVVIQGAGELDGISAWGEEGAEGELALELKRTLDPAGILIGGLGLGRGSL